MYVYDAEACLGSANFVILNDGTCVNDLGNTNPNYSYSMSIPYTGNYIQLEFYDPTCTTPQETYLTSFIPENGCLAYNSSFSYSMSLNPNGITYHGYTSPGCVGSSFQGNFQFGCADLVGEYVYIQSATLTATSTTSNAFGLFPSFSFLLITIIVLMF